MSRHTLELIDIQMVTQCIIMYGNKKYVALEYPELNYIVFPWHFVLRAPISAPPVLCRSFALGVVIELGFNSHVRFYTSFPDTLE